VTIKKLRFEAASFGLSESFSSGSFSVRNELNFFGQSAKCHLFMIAIAILLSIDSLFLTVLLQVIQNHAIAPGPLIAAMHG
jgi:hypothetical protein